MAAMMQSVRHIFIQQQAFRSFSTISVTSSIVRHVTKLFRPPLYRVMTSSVGWQTQIRRLSKLSSLGPEPSAVGATVYEYERSNFKLERPEFFNFASDVIDYWAEIERVSECIYNMLQ